MKSSSQVRRPNLTGSELDKDTGKRMSVGDTLRKAKSDLFFSRCVCGILIVLIVIALAMLIYLGYADVYIDKFFAMMS